MQTTIEFEIFFAFVHHDVLTKGQEVLSLSGKEVESLQLQFRYLNGLIPFAEQNAPGLQRHHNEIPGMLENIGKESERLMHSHQGKPIVLGVCAMDVKARSKAMREILTRLVERASGAIKVKVFGDKVILDEGLPLFSGLPPNLHRPRRRKLAKMRHSHLLLFDRLSARQGHLLCQTSQPFLHQRPALPGTIVGSSSRRCSSRPPQSSHPSPT
jgi:hypothetical protein